MKKRIIFFSSFVLIIAFVAGKTLLRSEAEQAEEAQKAESKISERFKLLLLGAAGSAAKKLVKGIRDFGVEYLQKEVNKGNMYRATVGYARERFEKSSREQQYVIKRVPHVVNAQSDYFDTSLTQRDALKVGLVFSGGGYRAMILTTGYMEALSSLGLVDSSMYISTLSGSTWFLAPWLLSKKTVSDFKYGLVDKINTGRFDLSSLNAAFQRNPRRLVNDILWPKFLFDQPVGSVDIYGALLAHALLSDFGKERQQQHLSRIWEDVKMGQNPFPIFTAVSMTQESSNTYRYNWYEFNPLEVCNIEYGIALDTYAFGRPFEKGQSLNFAPEQSLGYVMGIFGSAYTVNLKDLQDRSSIGIEKEYKPKSKLEKLKAEASALIMKSVASETVIKTVGTKRVAPAQVHNPWKGLDRNVGKKVSDWLRERDYITLVDAGIDFNLPIPPLLDAQRDLDVIIVADSSGGVKKGQLLQKQLDKAFEYLEKKGYSYQEYEEMSHLFNNVFQVYKDYQNHKAPIVIYINYQVDPNLFETELDNEARQLVDQYDLRNFDSIACTKDGHCNTFNFKYSPDQLLQLAGIAEFNIIANKDRLHTVMEEALAHKRKKNEVSYVPGAQDLVEDYITVGF